MQKSDANYPSFSSVTSLYKTDCREDHHQQFNNKTLKSLHCSSIKFSDYNSANDIIVGNNQLDL